MNKNTIFGIIFLVAALILGGLYIHSKQSTAPKTATSTADVVSADQCKKESTEAMGPVPDGVERQFVHLLAVGTSSKQNSILFVDPIEQCAPGETATSGEPCFFKNTKREQKILTLSPSVQIFMQTLHHDQQGNYCWDEKIDFDTFVHTMAAPGSVYPKLPYAIELQNNEVTKIVERYIP